MTIPSNKVVHAAVWPLVHVLPWAETPSSAPSSMLNCLLSCPSCRITSTSVLRATALLRHRGRLACCAWSRRRRIDPEDQRPFPLDVHPPTVFVGHRSWLRLLLVVGAFVSDDSFLECDLPLIPRVLLPATASGEEVLAVLIALFQLPEPHVTTTDLAIGLLVEVLVWIRRVQPRRAQVAEVCLTPVANPIRMLARVAQRMIMINTYM